MLRKGVGEERWNTGFYIKGWNMLRICGNASNASMLANAPPPPLLPGDE